MWLSMFVISLIHHNILNTIFLSLLPKFLALYPLFNYMQAYHISSICFKSMVWKVMSYTDKSVL